MAKYRNLTSIELEALESDFIKFLVLNGISGDDWIKIKNKDNDEALKMISLFSDVVFEGIIRKTQYIEFFDTAGLKMFKCDENEISLISLKRIDGDICDYAAKDLLFETIKTKPEAFGTFRASKDYKPDRSRELFQMIESGGTVTDGSWYKLFDKIVD